MQILIEAFLLGLVGGLVPGSILTIILISVLQGGYKSGLRAFFWSFLAELTIVSILLLFVLSLPFTTTVFSYIGMIGGVVLFYFAYQILGISKISNPENQETLFSGRQIYLMSATNAPLYIFWITVCAPLIWKLTEQFSVSIAAVSFLGFFEFGWALSTLVILLLFVKSRKILTNPFIMKRVYQGVSLFMFFLGARILYTSLTALFV